MADFKLKLSDLSEILFSKAKNPQKSENLLNFPKFHAIKYVSVNRESLNKM